MSSEQRDIADGTLVVRTAKEGDTHTISLCGELDLANAGTAETALQASLAENAPQIVIDMRELEFIDSTGIALLVAALGNNGSDERVRFIPSTAPAVTRVLELTGLSERLPLAEA
ncbi:MAG TPA: STAS domain-containing protein [Solirubrobacterales bacterium]|jgi:anti-sigma B factor antagonist|nr:STAS domain-containing protein [Solirubrobacterales bacterium]